MAFDVFLADCPARTTLALIAHRWSVVVLHGLADGPCRFGGLQQRIGGIGPKALAETLERLRASGLVVRSDAGHDLSDLGRSLSPIVRSLAAWAEDHAAEIVAAQDDHQRRTSHSERAQRSRCSHE